MRTLFLLFTLATSAVAQEVTFERLVNSAKEPGNWMTYSGNYFAHQYSALDQINSSNISRLHVKWIYPLKTTHKVETVPLVADGVMYLTSPPNNVLALDPETGRKLWSFEYKLPPKVIACCGQVNRGLAILGHTLFMNTVDAKVLALDARTGRVLWKTEMVNYEEGYAATSAPLIARDKVIVGMAGGEYGARGFIDAYYAATGQRAWRFYTTAGPGDENFGSWPGDTWKTGGATTWATGAFDPELNLIYWGTGNPGPDYNGDVRAGDNLYSDSML
ncbi:MAG TPA: PQQ-binding-like beta-propeller repeat protein, partial [Bryobacteraceae bacterium]|nr:PQQ-binding-like beta-propeller repeat protein [Bryobacteraceae bacterium]